MNDDYRLPLLVPSYNRPNAPLIGLAQRVLKDDYPWAVFVRKSQARDYLDAGLGRGHIVTMPDAEAPNVGSTRNWILRWAHSEGYDQIFDWDDDVFRIGIKGPKGSQKDSSRVTGNIIPWFDGTGYWDEASRISRETFEMYPGTVAGSIQNQRWCKPFTVQVQCGKTPRRTKIMHVERILENNLIVPSWFRRHGDDIGAAAMYLQYGWEVFTIGNLTYDFVSETDIKLPSTLRDRDEEKNKAIHAQEFADLQRYEIADYLRVTKAYEDGSYMYGDVDWRKFRKLSGQVGYEHEYSNVMERKPLQDIPRRIIK